MSEALYKRATQVLEANLGDELIALDVQGGYCFGFNSVATTIWNQLSSPKSVAEIEVTLLAEYDVDRAKCRAELRELLDELVRSGLVEQIEQA